MLKMYFLNNSQNSKIQLKKKAHVHLNTHQVSPSAFARAGLRTPVGARVHHKTVQCLHTAYAHAAVSFRPS